MADGSALAAPQRADAPATGSPKRPGPPTVTRRRPMPGSRAVVGGLLVAVSAVGLFVASTGTGQGPGHRYLVARHSLAPGTPLSPADLQPQRMDLSPALRGRVFDDASALAGATVVAPLEAGELVQQSAVVARRDDSASRELSFPVDRGRLSADIKPGERVDVLGTYGTGADAFTSVVVRGALVVSLERSRGSLADSGGSVLTLALDHPNDTLALAHAVQLAKLTVVRATGAPVLDPLLPPYRPARTAS